MCTDAKSLTDSGLKQLAAYKEFRSAFVRPEQRRAFLLDCAEKGFRAIRAAWPSHNIRMFIFGSAAKRPINIGANSDLDIAVHGLEHLASKSWERNAILLDIFKSGLSEENQQLPVDMVSFDAENPTTILSEEILRHGIEIKLD